MLLGPFNSFHIQELVDYLNQKNIEHQLIQDPEAIQKIRDADKAKNPGNPNDRLFRSSGDFLYLEINDNDMSLVYPAIEKFGIVPANAPESAELLESAEYHCLHCDYTSDQPGVCKRHSDDRLLEFSEWIQARELAGYLGNKGRLYFFLFVFGFAVIGLILRRLGYI